VCVVYAMAQAANLDPACDSTSPSCSTLIVLLCGLPGSGKSSVAAGLAMRDELAASLRIVDFDILERSLLARTADDKWDPYTWHQSRIAAFDNVGVMLRVDVGSCPRIILLDDNMYYKSMRQPYKSLARESEI
jgi:tRNA uridine 5-carbamoylmethylation protein Kti12